MFNEEHLKILNQGAKVWNRWRKANPKVEPNFMTASLRNADLSNANLRDTNLVMADLQWADLSNADLSKSSFLIANLSYANLSHAKLRAAVFWEANLSNARLCNALLNGAYFGSTVLGNTDLSNATGLDSCSHDGPSVLDIRTLAKSGKLPLNFLRGCGLPDALIEYLPLLSDPVQFYSCFISYSSKNQAFAEKLHADLQNKGVRCWFAPEDLKWGDETRTRIDESINRHDKLLLILSKQSIASDWVKKEVETAMERESKQKRIILFPIRLDNAVMKIDTGWAADIRRTRNIGDFHNWKNPDAYQKALDRLLHDLKTEH